MSTVIQDAYRETRGSGGRGCGHYAALRVLARRYGLDPDTVGRSLKRADEADAIDRRRAGKRAQRGTQG